MIEDIDNILKNTVVPEMECEKKPRTRKTPVTRADDDVPEVVLPKTKAEVYREAKERLTKKTAAVSRDKKQPRTKSKTVELEIAAAAEAPQERIKMRAERLRKPAAPVWVGAEEELVPFAWRNPLEPNITRPSKLYKRVAASGRDPMLPAPRDNK